MENLKQYIRDNFDFDTRYTFEENLNSNLDNKTIYFSKCKEFYDVDSATVISLAKSHCLDLNSCRDDTDLITQAARYGMEALVYDYMYSELEETFKNMILEELPKEVEFDLDELDYEEEDLQDSEIMGELVGDYLSDTYDFLHYGFDYKIKNNKVFCSNIEWDVSSN